MFQLDHPYQPSGDQPKAIASIIEGFSQQHMSAITLLGATGTGKTYTMANVIESLKRPTLVLSHNKTLAAQLATEFKYFFPNNAVHYFVSYFDYYQPESYLPEKGIYIEKEATINHEIEMYRLATMASLLSREDVIVVSSVSSLYGLWSKTFFQDNRLYAEVGKHYSIDEIKLKLILMQYKPFTNNRQQGMFEVRGDTIDIAISTEKAIYRLYFNDTVLERIEVRDALTYQFTGERQHMTCWPATQFMQDMSELDNAIAAIEAEMEERCAYYEKQNMLTEAQRLKKKVLYDTKMIKETGFVNGIENYSPYFEKRLDGTPPHTLFEYFPDDCLIIVDESHMTIPQLAAMPRGDRSRKETLVEHGFRLPSALHHRPVNFEELQLLLWRDPSIVPTNKVRYQKTKKQQAKTLFVSATPAEYEIKHTNKIVEQIIRPTGLLDPVTYVYPKGGDYTSLVASLDKLKTSAHLLTEDYADVQRDDLIF
jgi:excinuclease ABC subunit B